MSEQYDVYDNRGNKIGTARKTDDGTAGCCLISTIVVIALIIGAISGISHLWQLISNYATYHVWIYNTYTASLDASATAEAPYHYEEEAGFADFNGRISKMDLGGYEVVHLNKDATLTFPNVSVQSKSTYTLTVDIGYQRDSFSDYNEPSLVTYTVYARVNGRPGPKFSFTYNRLTYNGSLESFVTVMETVELNGGKNTIQFYNASGGGDNCNSGDASDCIGLAYIVVDKA